MLRKLACVLVAALVLVGGVLVAAEIKGTVKKVDGSEITVTTDGDKDVTFSVNDDTKVTVGNKGNPPKDREKALKNLKAGAKVEAKTEKKGNKEIATELKILGGKKKDKQ